MKHSQKEYNLSVGNEWDAVHRTPLRTQTLIQFVRVTKTRTMPGHALGRWRHWLWNW